MSNVLVTICVHYESVPEIVAMLKTLVQCPYPDHKILVVDNASSLEAYRALEKELAGLSCELVRNEKNDGFGSGVNFGFRVAQKYNPKYLQVINPDTEVVDSSYIQKMVDILEADPQIGIIGPAVMKGNRVDFEPTILPFISLKSAIQFRSKYSEVEAPQIDEKCHEVESVHGVCFIVRADVYEKIGGFDESFFMYSEEQDLCYRIAKLDYKRIFWAGKSILHDGASRDNEGLINWRDIYIRRNQVRFIRKHRSWLEAFALATIFSSRLFLKYVARRQTFAQYPVSRSIGQILQPLIR
jgi:GT2 family glycosyltransferase